MEPQELQENLREALVALNTEARLAGEATLARCLDEILDGPGADWLLESMERLGLSDATRVRQNLEEFIQATRTEEGRRELRKELAQRRPWVEAHRRRVVAHQRAWQAGARNTGVTFESEEDAGASDAYSLLVRGRQHGEGGAA